MRRHSSDVPRRRRERGKARSTHVVLSPRDVRLFLRLVERSKSSSPIVRRRASEKQERSVGGGDARGSTGGGEYRTRGCARRRCCCRLRSLAVFWTQQETQRSARAVDVGRQLASSREREPASRQGAATQAKRRRAQRARREGCNGYVQLPRCGVLCHTNPDPPPHRTASFPRHSFRLTPAMRPGRLRRLGGRGRRGERDDARIERLVLEVDPAAQDVDQALHRRPPLHLAAAVLRVGRRNHLGDGDEADFGALDRDRRRAGRLRDVLLLEPVDALDRQADGARAVARGGDAALERVTERDEARVEQVLALLGQDVRDDLGRVRLGRLLRTANASAVSNRMTD